jgi:NTP pyrophosphatase (non-canonical NTP hydrolase)
MTKIEPTFDEYQKYTNETAIYPEENAMEYLVMGLVGEAGEVANKYKKVIRDKGGEMTHDDRKNLAKELGDVLWYQARIADELGVDFSVVAMDNINKLFDRLNRGVIGGSGDER